MAAGQQGRFSHAAVVPVAWDSVLTMRWFPAAGTLRYFIDGKHHPRFDVVSIPPDLALQWAVNAVPMPIIRRRQWDVIVTVIEIVDGHLASSL
jgi:hypothetical protein